MRSIIGIVRGVFAPLLVCAALGLASCSGNFPTKDDAFATLVAATVEAIQQSTQAQNDVQPPPTSTPTAQQSGSGSVVLGDDSPPVISDIVPASQKVWYEETDCGPTSTTVSARIVDAAGNLDFAEVAYRFAGYSSGAGSDWFKVPMKNNGGDTYITTIDATWDGQTLQGNDGVIEYQVFAYDKSGNQVSEPDGNVLGIEITPCQQQGPGPANSSGQSGQGTQSQNNQNQGSQNQNNQQGQSSQNQNNQNQGNQNQGNQNQGSQSQNSQPAQPIINYFTGTLDAKPGEMIHLEWSTSNAVCGTFLEGSQVSDVDSLSITLPMNTTPGPYNYTLEAWGGPCNNPNVVSATWTMTVTAISNSQSSSNAAPQSPQTITVSPSELATYDATDYVTWYGQAWVGQDSNNHVLNGVINFDLSQIPAGATINYAYLWFPTCKAPRHDVVINAWNQPVNVYGTGRVKVGDTHCMQSTLGPDWMDVTQNIASTLKQQNSWGVTLAVKEGNLASPNGGDKFFTYSGTYISIEYVP